MPGANFHRLPFQVGQRCEVRLRGGGKNDRAAIPVAQRAHGAQSRSSKCAWQALRFIEDDHASRNVVQFAAVAGFPAEQRLKEAYRSGKDEGRIPASAELAIFIVIFPLAVVLKNIGKDLRVLPGGLLDQRKERQHDDDAAFLLAQRKVEQSQSLTRTRRRGQRVKACLATAARFAAAVKQAVAQRIEAGVGF